MDLNHAGVRNQDPPTDSRVEDGGSLIGTHLSHWLSDSGPHCPTNNRPCTQQQTDLDACRHTERQVRVASNDARTDDPRAR